MPDQKHYLTQEKFDALTKELDVLRKDKRREIAEELEYAKSLGDLSENAEYHEARAAQGELEDRINQLEATLRQAIIVAHKGKHDTATVGATVTVRRTGESKDVAYAIVGTEEADVAARKISLHSAFGAAMAGKRKGEHFSFATPKGKMEYTIVAIE